LARLTRRRAVNAGRGGQASEHAPVREIADEGGERSAACHKFGEGGKGATELAEAVVEAAAEPSSFHFLYTEQMSLRDKIETIATKVYGAGSIEYQKDAAAQLDSYERNGFGGLGVCIAKTHLSISSDPALKGAPTGWQMR